MARPVQFLPAEAIQGRLLPWVIGVMVFLSGLALAAAVGLQALTGEWRAGLEDSLTVQIVGPDRSVLEQEAEAAVGVLRDLPEVEDARKLSDAAIQQLLEPWLGAGAPTDALPIPLLIDVTLKQGARLDPDRLARDLHAVAPSAQVDAHEHWLSDLVTLTRLVQGLSALILGLIVLATVTVIVFATRAGLAAQRETVAIVHLMGAEDRQIAAAFQRRFLIVGIQGALLGLLGLGLLFGTGYIVSETIETAMLPMAVPPAPALYALLLLPLPAALITMVTARVTVRRALAEMN